MDSDSRSIATIASLVLALSVIMGAFGAHALAEVVTPKRLSTFHTAVDYQIMHGFGLFIIAFLHRYVNAQRLQWPFRLMFVGLLIFSGSLYVLVLFDVPQLGMLTPLGGIMLIASWLFLAMAIYKGDADESRD